MTFSLIKKVLRKIRSVGFKRTVKCVLQSCVLFTKIDPLNSFSFIKNEEEGCLKSFDSNFKSVNWIIPDFGESSGGHLNIFRFVHLLEKRGYKNTIAIIGKHNHKNEEAAKNSIHKHFFEIKAKVVFGIENLPEAYYTFATSWITAYFLKKFKNTVHKLYFIQDFEPYFYAKGSEYEFANETYTFGYKGICAGGWLAKKLEAEFSMDCYSIGFSYDKALYKKTEKRDLVKRVFCYCRPPTSRRGLESALISLDMVAQKLKDVEFVFAGWDMKNYYFPHPHVNAGIVSLDKLGDLYNQCDAALVFSFTNLSLLPLELMACGVVVISNKGDNAEWLLNDDNSILVDSSPKAISDAIIDIINDPEKRKVLSSNALALVEKTSWEDEADKLDMILKEIHTKGIN